MKRKQSQKKENRPPESLQNPASAKPPSMDDLFKNPENYQQSDLLDSLSNPRLRQVMYELFSSIGDIPRSPEDKRPEWAINAWKEFWRSSGLLPQGGSEASQLGYGVGLVSEVSPDAFKVSPDMSKMFSHLLEMFPKLRENAAHSPPEQAASFFSAQKAGKKRSDQLGQVSQRTKIFLAIAILWELVAEFKSTAELFQWLRSVGGDKGQTYIAPTTDSREIRTVCKIIGLRYGSRGGRPPKKTRS